MIFTHLQSFSLIIMSSKELEKGCILTPKIFTCNSDLNSISYFKYKINTYNQIPLETQS